MMRNWVARVCLVSAALLLVTGGADAQKKKKKGGAAAPPPAAAPAAPGPAAPPPAAAQAAPAGKAPAKKGEQPRDIELDDAGGGAPVQAGQMTEEAANAKRLFDTERWSEAALGLYRVYKGETGDDAGNRQVAQYHLAIALYRLKFFQASYGIFSEIADKPNHLKFAETLLWLSKLATQLPEPADIVERVGKYTSDAVSRFKNPQQIDLYWQLNYMLGRYKYRNRQYEEAIQLLDKVDSKSRYFVQAQFFAGISYVQLRRSVPAVQAFQKVVTAIDEGTEGVEDEARMRDLAFLSMARTYYSASIKLDENNTPSIDSTKLSAAVKYWNKVDIGSEYWLDGLFEESWAYFMAGDFPRAMGNIHTIGAPYFPKSFQPEAEILKAVIYFTNCNYPEATTVVAKFKAKYEPIRKDLEGVLARFKGENQEEPFFKFLKEVRSGNANLPPTIKPIVELALSDRQLLRNIEYVRVLDEEQARFKKAPSSFQSSALGGEVQDGLQLARDLAVRNAGNLARERYQRAVDELAEHMRDGAKILIDIVAAQRNQLDAAITTGQMSKEESKVFGVVNPDEEHVLWPFDGEFWRDELGFYRQVVVSRCGR
jgi:tetratricopeptide (TPR) repeat protein